MRRHLPGGPRAAAEASLPVVTWHRRPTDGGPGVVAYRGWLRGRRGLRLHHGFDDWEGEPREVALEPVDHSSAIAVVPEVGEHAVLDLVVTDGERWDDNYGADYRLWVGQEPVDAHTHASRAGMGARGADALDVALRSAGVHVAVVSWRDNRFVDRLAARRPGLHPLVWVHPGHTTVEAVRRRLATGHVGLKLHPEVDRYPADDPRLDPYLEVAAEFGRPATVHSAPGLSDPDRIRALAERHPTVPVILYHTYLGPPEGRVRAAAHAQQQPNLYLETSWCAADVVLALIDRVGPDRVIFGSDAVVDGHEHYTRSNVEGRESYNRGLVHLARRLDPVAFEQVAAGTTRRLFRLAPDAPPVA